MPRRVWNGNCRASAWSSRDWPAAAAVAVGAGRRMRAHQVFDVAVAISSSSGALAVAAEQRRHGRVRWKTRRRCVTARRIRSTRRRSKHSFPIDDAVQLAQCGTTRRGNSGDSSSSRGTRGKWCSWSQVHGERGRGRHELVVALPAPQFADQLLDGASVGQTPRAHGRRIGNSATATAGATRAP
jgi:hypothetical protein